MITLQEINERNRRFWEVQILKTEQAMCDPALREAAMAELNGYAIRKVPASLQRSLDEILSRQTEFRERIISALEPEVQKRVRIEQARKAGRTKRPDALQRLIIKLATRNPKM